MSHRRHRASVLPSAFANLLLPEASVDDAPAQVVYPLPLDDVIEDELPAHGRLQPTWRAQTARWVFHNGGGGEGADGEKKKATWDGRDLFPSHPQEVSHVELPDVERNSVPAQLRDQLLLPMVAAAARTDREGVVVLVFFKKTRRPALAPYPVVSMTSTHRMIS